MAKTPSYSSKSESWTARIPNNLAALARERAIALYGTANTTEIIHAALKQWVGMTDNLTNSVEPNVIQRLESQIAELFDKLSNTVSRTELEEVRELVAPYPSNVSTEELCKYLEVSYTNLSTRGKRFNRSPEEQLIAEALERGQKWRVCDREGTKRLWERIK